MAVVHAQTKETLVLPVHHPRHPGARPRPVGLRRLHHGHVGLAEPSPQSAQPLRVHHIVRVHHRYPSGGRVGLAQPFVECAGLVAGPTGQSDEAHTQVTQRALLFHIGLHRHPASRVVTVVVDDENLEVRPIQGLQASNGRQHHGGGLVAARQVHTDHGRGITRRHRPCPSASLQAALPEQLGKLEGLGQQDRRHEQQGRDQQGQQHRVQYAQVVGQRPSGQDHHQGGHGLRGDAKGQATCAAHVRCAHQEGPQHQNAQQCSRRSLAAPIGVALCRPCPIELGHATCIQHAPMGTNLAFGGDLPRLVDGLHEEVVGVRTSKPGRGHELAHESGLRQGRSRCLVERALYALFHPWAGTGPAHFRYHHGLAWVSQP